MKDSLLILLFDGISSKYRLKRLNEFCKHFAKEILKEGSRSEGPLWVKSRHWPVPFAVSPLFGQRYLKLDGRQLRRRHADALQKRQSAMVVKDVGELGLVYNLSQARAL